MYASLFYKPKKPYFVIEKFTLSDGDFLEPYWSESKPKKNQSIVVLFHGLAGSYKSSYIVAMMMELRKNGYAVVLMHFRGCATKENTLVKSYHSGETEDAKEYLDYLHKKYPSQKLYALGYSIGGNMLLKLLGEQGENSQLTSAISVSAPIDLKSSAKGINQGFSKIYQWYLLKSIKKKLLKKYEKFDMPLQATKEDVRSIKTIYEFDELYTAPIHGFKSADNYYELNSSKQYLKDIKVKTLIIHSLDDPFMSENILPYKDEYSKSVELEITKNGGHLGFINGTICKLDYYLEKRVVNFFKDDKE